MTDQKPSWFWWAIGGLGTALAVLLAVLTGRRIPEREPEPVHTPIAELERDEIEKSKAKLVKADDELAAVAAIEDDGERLDALAKLVNE